MMTAVILCGGENLRLKGYFNTPKPLVEVKGKKILTYIIEQYQSYGIDDFILLVGENEQLYKEFAKTTSKRNIQVLQTGKTTPTGGRLFCTKELLKDNDTFFLTYGDGISDVNIKLLLEFHRQHKKAATLTAVQPNLSYGLLNIDNEGIIHSFVEKPKVKEYINGGFFVLNSTIFDYLTEYSDFEKDVLPKLADKNQLMAYKHHKFWKSLDTYKDYLNLEDSIHVLNANDNE